MLGRQFKCVAVIVQLLFVNIAKKYISGQIASGMMESGFLNFHLLRRGSFHQHLTPGKNAAYDSHMYLKNYKPQNFAAAYDRWGRDLTYFLCNIENIARAETASELGRPAAQPLARPLLTCFGETAKEFRFRQLVGHMLRHVMEARGWILDQTEVRIPDGPLFTRAARYVRPESPETTRCATPISSEDGSDIKLFFDYFRKRHKVAATLPATFGQIGDEMTPDQHILVGAGLDALAMHWANLCKGPSQHQERMAEFLSTHGGHECFDRVAGPYLFRHAVNYAKKKKKTDHKTNYNSWIKHIEQAIGIKPTGAEFCYCDKDITLKEIQSILKKTDVPPQWAKSYLYGGMIYKGYRCSWVHESDEGLITTRTFSNDLTSNPHYESQESQRILVFPGRFLLNTYEKAINSFESYCQKNNVVPASHQS